MELFSTEEYIRHDEARLQHLGSIGLPILGKRVLDLGAGIGRHAEWYLANGAAEVVAVDAREENLEILRARVPTAKTILSDLESASGWEPIGWGYDLCHMYGLLYHLANIYPALYNAGACTATLVLETQVIPGDDLRVESRRETPDDPTQGTVEEVRIPTRRWVWRALKGMYDHVYIPTTQPNHPEFPTDWRHPNAGINRAVFVASIRPIWLSGLSCEMLDQQERCRA